MKVTVAEIVPIIHLVCRGAVSSRDIQNKGTDDKRKKRKGEDYLYTNEWMKVTVPENGPVIHIICPRFASK